MRKRVVAVVNKWWECDPILAVLLNDNARPAKALGWPRMNRHPRPRPDPAKLPAEDPSPAPRAVFALARSDVEVWCISDLLEHLPDGPIQSSSEQKARQLPKVFRGSASPDLTIALGTAAAIDQTPNNGMVVVGARAFLYDAHPNGSNPASRWTDGPFGKVLDSAVDPRLFATITRVESPLSATVTQRHLPPPNNAAPRPLLAADRDAVALSFANVTDYADYATIDEATVKAFAAVKTPYVPGSVETTHGVIRACSGEKFIFISGITDRVGRFAEDVGPRTYAQNTAAAHNAGVILAWMLPLIDSAI